MAYVNKRPTGRFTGYYTDAVGVRRSAGTYDTYEEALVRARDAEASPTGSTNPAASQTYGSYVSTWLLTETRILPQTLRGYEGNLNKHVLPILGRTPLAKITPAVVRETLAKIEEAGASGWTLAQCKSAMGSSFKPLVPDVLSVNPTHGIRVDVPPTKPFELVEPDTFKKIIKHLTPAQRLFASFLVSTGARFGEASEVRVKDFNFRTREVTFMRRVSQLGAKRTGGDRFVPVGGTKAGRSRSRSVLMEEPFVTDVFDWIKDNDLQPDDLVFPKRLVSQPKRRRASRANTTGHLPNDEWNDIWHAACDASGIGWRPRTHDLRHAYATQLVARNVSIYEVKELLGHRLIETTLKYQHRVAAQRSKAASAAAEFLR